MNYSVGETARLTGVSASAIRYYEKEGLLPGLKRSSGGVRVFSDSDFERLRLITCLKSTGMQIKDIRLFMSLVQQGDSTVGKRLELFKNRRLEIENQLEQLKNVLAVIDYKCWYYQQAADSGSVNKIDFSQIPPQAEKGRRLLENK